MQEKLTKTGHKNETGPVSEAGPLTAKTVLREYAEAVALALVLAFFLRAYVVQAFVVPSASMKDTLLVGDYIFVNKFAYIFNSPSRGDVVVFKHPRQDNDVNLGKWVKETFELVVYRKRVIRRDYIKRVIGVPGDVVFARGGTVYVNGEPLEEEYAHPPTAEFGPYRVPDESYFVMGDNRAVSRDSRDWGSVPKRLIKGRAMFIYWSSIPRECGQHRSRISKPAPREIEKLVAENKYPQGGYVYVCEGGGELLKDYEDARIAPWYAFWERIRWGRIGRIIR